MLLCAFGESFFYPHRYRFLFSWHVNNIPNNLGIANFGGDARERVDTRGDAKGIAGMLSACYRWLRLFNARLRRSPPPPPSFFLA